MSDVRTNHPECQQVAFVSCLSTPEAGPARSLISLQSTFGGESRLLMASLRPPPPDSPFEWISRATEPLTGLAASHLVVDDGTGRLSDLLPDSVNYIQTIRCATPSVERMLAERDPAGPRVLTSRSLAHHYWEYLRPGDAVIHTGVPVGERLQEKESRLTVLCCRLARQRGVENILRQNPGLGRVVVCGDGPQRRSLERAFPDVEFVGWVDPEPWLAKAEVSVHWSDYAVEGMWRAPFEAMAQGCGVIANRGGDLPYCFTKKTVRFVDRVTQLKCVWRRLLQMDSERQKLCEASFRAASWHDERLMQLRWRWFLERQLGREPIVPSVLAAVSYGHERPQHLRMCLASLARQAVRPRVVVFHDVSRGTDPELKARLAEEYPWVEVHEVNYDAGPGLCPAKVRNAVFEVLAGEDIVWFLDGDCIVAGDATERVAASLEVWPDGLGIFPRYRIPLQSELPEVLLEPVLEATLPEVVGPRGREYRTEPSLNERAAWWDERSRWIIAAGPSRAVRAERLLPHDQTIRGWGGEDNEWGQRMFEQAGCRPVPGPTVYHQEHNGEPGRQESAGRKTSMVRGGRGGNKGRPAAARPAVVRPGNGKGAVVRSGRGSSSPEVSAQASVQPFVEPEPSHSGDGNWLTEAGEYWRPPVSAVPEVTVIVRCHGEPAAWIKGAVDSALTQEGISLEVLVVDDAGAPAAEAPLDERVGLLRLPVNMGLGYARWRGWQLARGEWLRMLDADDELPPGALAAQLNLAKRMGASACCGRLDPFGDERLVKASMMNGQWVQHAQLEQQWDGNPETLRRTVLESPATLLPGPTLLWRRTWGGEPGPEWVQAEDLPNQLVPLARDGSETPLVWLDRPVLRYRIHDRALTARGGRPDQELRRSLTQTSMAHAHRAAACERLAAEVERPLRMAYLEWALDVGGAQWALMQMTTHLDRRLVEPRWLVAEDSAGADWLRQRGVRVTVLGRHAFRERVAANLAAGGDDAVDVAWAAHLVSAQVANAVPRCFAHAQSTDLSRAQLTADEEDRAIVSRLGRIIAVSDDVKQAHPHLAPRAVVIPSPVDTVTLRQAAARRAVTRRALGVEPQQMLLIWSGRLAAPTKRVDLLRVVWDELRSDPRFRLLVLGSIGDWASSAGRLRTETETWTRDTGAIWLDNVEPWESPPLYAASDIYLSTSDVEGMSLSLLEGMAAGCVPVVTRTGGVGEVVADGLSGWVVEPGDAQDLVAVVRRLADEPAPRQRMASLARQVVAVRYDVRHNARQHALVYHGRPLNA